MSVSENARIAPAYPAARNAIAALTPAVPQPMMATTWSAASTVIAPSRGSALGAMFDLSLIPIASPYANTWASHGPYSPDHMPPSWANVLSQSNWLSNSSSQ